MFKVKKASFIFGFCLLAGRTIMFILSRYILLSCLQSYVWADFFGCSSLCPGCFQPHQGAARSWNLSLSKEPNEGLGSATVALTGEHRTWLLEVRVHFRTSFEGRRRCRGLGIRENRSVRKYQDSPVGDGGQLRCEVGLKSMLNGWHTG